MLSQVMLLFLVSFAPQMTIQHRALGKTIKATAKSRYSYNFF